MSESCKWLHQQLEQLPMISYPFDLKDLPKNGIYFFYEEGELWEHGGNKKRIVRIGTHKKENFRSRINDHYLFSKSKMNFDKDKSPPHDRSIFRKNIGRAILNRDEDKYLSVWEIDFMKKDNRNKYAYLRDIQKEKEIEEEITDLLRNLFSFRFIVLGSENERMGSSGLESLLIGTLSQCSKCKPSKNWFGRYSPIDKIRKSGLWQVQHLNSPSIKDQETINITRAIKETSAL